MTAMERFVDNLVLSDPDSPRPVVMVSQLIIDAKIDASDTNAVRFVVAQHLLDHEPTLSLREDLEERGWDDLLVSTAAAKSAYAGASPGL